MIINWDRPTATIAFLFPRRRASRQSGAEEGFGASGSRGGFAEDPGQVAVPVTVDRCLWLAG